MPAITFIPFKCVP